MVIMNFILTVCPVVEVAAAGVVVATVGVAVAEASHIRWPAGKPDEN